MKYIRDLVKTKYQQYGRVGGSVGREDAYQSRGTWFKIPSIVLLIFSTNCSLEKDEKKEKERPGIDHL